MPGDSNKQLVPKVHGALALTTQRDNRILSEMVGASLTLAKKNPPPRIVVLDDERAFVDLHVFLIRSRIQEVTVLPFTNVNEAFEELSRTTPSLFITDLIHPGLNGLAMFQRLAEMNVTCSIMVVSPSLARVGMENISGILRSKLEIKCISFLERPFELDHFFEVLDLSLSGIPPKAC